VCEVAPVGDIAGDEVGDAVDREIEVGVSEHDGDVDGGVELSCSQSGGDAAVTSSDGQQVQVVSLPGR
jgi:hypothetical protein